MKKFFVFVIALVAAVTVANAQTVEGSRLFNNTYVGIEGGVLSPINTPANTTWGNALRPTAGIEIGKDVTPVIGFSVEGLAAFNTIPSTTIVDQSNVVGNVKVNLSNWFGGYKGQPRRIEVIAVPGIGWGHNYGQVAAIDADGQTVYVDPASRNYLTYNAYGQVNVNMGKARAWQINVRPGVTWAATPAGDAFNANYAVASVRVGVTYKFGYKNSTGAKTHNFTNAYTVAEYAAIKAALDKAMAENDSLRKVAPVKEVVKETIKETVIKEKEVVKPANTIITFDEGQTILKSAEYAKLKNYASQVADGAEVQVVGSADLGTGSEKRNQYLAETRAKVVADELTKMGVKVAGTSVAFDTNETPEASRAAIVTVK